MQLSRSSPLLLTVLTFFLAAAAGGPLYLLWTGVERRLDDTSRNLSALQYNLPSPEQFRSICLATEEATEQALRRKPLRAEALKERLWLFLLSLQPQRLKEEADLCLLEKRGLHNKHVVWSVPLILFDMASTHTPDSTEARRIQPLRSAAEAYLGRPPEIDWSRPALLKLFCAAKDSLLRSDPESKKRAAAEFSEVLRYAPEFAPAYYLRGRARLDFGELSPALTDFRRAATLDPGMAAAHRWAADSLEKLGRFDEAISEADQALAMDPEYVEARALRDRMTRR